MHCLGNHEIYNFGRPFLGHHICILSLSDLCSVEEKIFKEIIHFHYGILLIKSRTNTRIFYKCLTPKPFPFFWRGWGHEIFIFFPCKGYLDGPVVFEKKVYRWNFQLRWAKSVLHVHRSLYYVHTSILPVSGWKPRAGSSVVILHCMAQPCRSMSSWLSPISGSRCPSAILIWLCTKSILKSENFKHIQSTLVL